MFSQKKSEKQIHKKLVVNQYIVKPVTAKIQAPPSLPSAKKKTTPLAPSPAKTPIKKTTLPPVKSQTSPQVQSALTQKLMLELEESIAKIEGCHDKVDTSLQLKTPHAIDTLKTTRLEQNTTNEDYMGTLVLCLRQSLNLPDFGEVTIRLTLRQDGSVQQLDVLKAESENNRRYLETHLPHVKFPALNNLKHTFVLTFCNEV